VTKRQSRILVTVFLVVLVGFCLLFTFGLSPWLQRAAERSDAFAMLGKCMEVASGDVMRIRQDGEERWVRLVGVEAPLMEGNPALAEQAARREVDPAWLAQQGRVTRNTLSAWIHRRNLHITYPLGDNARDDQGRYWVYAEVAGIDIARKLLQGGQMYAVDTEHPRRDIYFAHEQEAREKEIGIWRPGSVSLL